MQEIDRQCFVSLNRENNMFYVLNDCNFIFKFYSPSESKAKQIFDAWLKGGYRERYAVENGNVNWNPLGYANCISFNIPNEPHSDSNGVLYHTLRKEWVG